MEFWHAHITEESFYFLQNLRRKYSFILIGGWAVYFYTKALKSKDIDIIVEYDILGKIRDEYPVTKNDRLEKYEVKQNGVEVDIYLPHYSDLGVSLDAVTKNTIRKEGFILPRPELLLILKQHAHRERKHSTKGEKDKIDIFSLLSYTDIDWGFYKAILKNEKVETYLRDLKDLLSVTYEVKELGLSRFKTSRLKKNILGALS